MQPFVEKYDTGWASSFVASGQFEEPQSLAARPAEACVRGKRLTASPSRRYIAPDFLAEQRV
jgi:hypothetical protein